MQQEPADPCSDCGEPKVVVCSDCFERQLKAMDEDEARATLKQWAKTLKQETDKLKRRMNELKAAGVDLGQEPNKA